MKYVKVFDKEMIPIGVVDIENGIPQSATGQFVKVYNDNGEQVGVQELGAAVAGEGVIKVYDKDLKPIGTATMKAAEEDEENNG